MYMNNSPNALQKCCIATL